MHPSRIRLAATAALFLVAARGVPQAADQGAALGKIDFPASGSPAAMPDFLRGVLLLHSFEYADAAEAFRNAQKADPGFAMAYWGEAMTYNHPLWMQRDRAAAVKALERLAPTPGGRIAKAPTEREKMYMEAVEALWAEGDKADRDRAYAEAMRRLHERFPDDLDAAALYGLALLGTCEDHRDVRVYMQAAAIEEEVFAKNPDHPGAAHYLIHCYDDPVHAPLGMRAARVYAKIAPDAVHALHMPSHIFFASGMWDEAVASNEASWKASVERAARKGLPAGAHSFHALSWLEYANLQLGQWRDARARLATMEADAKADPGEMTSSSLSVMRAIWIVDTRRCEGLVPPSSATAPRDGFVRGLCALDSGDRAGAKVAAEALAAPAAAKADDETHAHGGGGSSYGRGGESVGRVLGLELQALLAFNGKNPDEGLRLAAEAAAAEDAMSFEFGPPVVVKPAHELSGELLLAAGKPADARREFETSLSHDPGRALSLLGLARAQAAAGDAVASKETSAKLAKQWSHADPDVRNRAEVLAGAGK
jgi:tetratricopeptide (TPR) repeat protein